MNCDERLAFKIKKEELLIIIFNKGIIKWVLPRASRKIGQWNCVCFMTAIIKW